MAPRSIGSVVSGEGASDTLQFSQGDDVYLRIASGFTAKAGEQFLVVRPAKDPTRIPWFRGEKRLKKRMGVLWEDVGRVRVVRLAKDIAIARIESSCVPMERGDLLLAFHRRSAPPLPAAPFEGALKVTGARAIGRLVGAKDFRQVLATGYIAYVNLGSRRGVKIGDRLIFFLYPGRPAAEISRVGDGGSGRKRAGNLPTRDKPGPLPPEILGEGIVLRVSPTAATVLITSSRREINLGDYAELE